MTIKGKISSRFFHCWNNEVVDDKTSAPILLPGGEGLELRRNSICYPFRER
jgi:hypothetical protein